MHHPSPLRALLIFLVGFVIGLILVQAGCVYTAPSTVALCGEDAPPLDAEIDAAPPPIDAAPDAGCTANPAPPAVFADTTGQGHPSVTLLAPSSYAANPCLERPLLLYLNGYGGDGGTIVGRFQHTNIQNDHDVLVLAPTGIVGSTAKRRWNATPACCEPVQPANDDVHYLSNLVERVRTAGWSVDPKRVFVLGMSNGGFMATRLVCERPDLFVGAVAVASSGMSGGIECSTALAHAHIALLHSKADSTILYNGGTMNLPPMMPSAYPKIEGAGGTIEQLIAKNGCTGALSAPEVYKYDFDWAGVPYPPGVLDTDELVVGGCPADGSITLWRAPYPAAPGGATYGHSIHATPEFGATVWAWIAAHPRP